MTPEQYAKRLAAKRRFNEKHRERLAAVQRERRRQWRKENPLPTAEERFFARVNKDGPVARPELGPCWIWQGGTDDWGYGVVTIGRRVYKAHRFAWFLKHGALPQNLACHHCDTPACVRADHLFDGTHADNGADMDAKGRRAPGLYRARNIIGEKSPVAKLRDAQVHEIRARAAAGELQYKLAEEFGVSRSLINRIVRGLKRRHAA